MRVGSIPTRCNPPSRPRSANSALVVYCGKSATVGSTGPGVAERLGWATSPTSWVWISRLIFTLCPVEAGTRVHVMPAVVSRDKGDLKVRKPNVRGIMQAKKAAVDVRPAAVGASTVRVVGCALPPAKPAGKSTKAVPLLRTSPVCSVRRPTFSEVSPCLKPSYC